MWWKIFNKENTNKDLNIKLHNQNLDGKSNKEKYQLIAFGIIISTLFVFSKPALYTYFIRKAQKTDDVKARALYAKKAISFSNIARGRKLYNEYLMDYIKSISIDNPEKALELIQRESNKYPDNDYSKGFVYSYIGLALKVIDFDPNNALYNFIKAEMYTGDRLYNNKYSELLNVIIKNKLKSDEKIFNRITGDINGDGIVELGLVVSNGTASRFVVFTYQGNDFIELYSKPIASNKVNYIKYISLDKKRKAFALSNMAKDSNHEIIVVSNKKEDIDCIYYGINRFGYVLKDLDLDKNIEIGINSDPSLDNKKFFIRWLKWDGYYFKYFKTTHPYNEEIDIINDENLLR